MSSCDKDAIVISEPQPLFSAEEAARLSPTAEKWLGFRQRVALFLAVKFMNKKSKDPKMVIIVADVIDFLRRSYPPVVISLLTVGLFIAVIYAFVDASQVHNKQREKAEEQIAEIRLQFSSEECQQWRQMSEEERDSFLTERLSEGQKTNRIRLGISYERRLMNFKCPNDYEVESQITQQEKLRDGGFSGIFIEKLFIVGVLGLIAIMLILTIHIMVVALKRGYAVGIRINAMQTFEKYLLRGLALIILLLIAILWILWR